MPTVRPRTAKSRVMFNTKFPEWRRCMDTCTKYRGARAPAVADQAEMEELRLWAYNTTIDPVTQHPYEYGGKLFWMAYK